MFYWPNFGHNGPKKYHGLGLNAKMSELQAAMGLNVLTYMEHILTERQCVCDYYDQHLEFLEVPKLKIREHTYLNYSYYPVIFKTEEELIINPSSYKDMSKVTLGHAQSFYFKQTTQQYIDLYGKFI
jgi:dTDP-4-amino-4,6-dideoxygalactose transaminase